MVYVPESFSVVVLSSIEVSSALAFKIRQGCVKPERLVLCFGCSDRTSLFYGFTADVSDYVNKMKVGSSPLLQLIVLIEGDSHRVT